MSKEPMQRVSRINSVDRLAQQVDDATQPHPAAIQTTRWHSHPSVAPMIVIDGIKIPQEAAARILATLVSPAEMSGMPLDAARWHLRGYLERYLRQQPHIDLTPYRDRLATLLFEHPEPLPNPPPNPPPT